VALRDWQAALGQLVEARAAGRPPPPAHALASLDLDDAEQAWLGAVTRSRGFALTALVPRWWRETRVRRSARLTFAALGAEAPARLQDYLRAVASFTLFFVPEGVAFLDYIDALSVPTHVRAVARFERAMWRARLADRRADAPSGALPDRALPDRALPDRALPDGTQLMRCADATIVAFEAPPDQVLAALVQGLPPPEPDGAVHHVLVAPGLPGLWRLATDAETRLFLSRNAADNGPAFELDDHRRS
jgi:hypothetical protein